MIRVQHLQSNEVHVFSTSEFFYYLVGLCEAGRHPLLHISSSLNNSADCNSIGVYNVIIEFRN